MGSAMIGVVVWADTAKSKAVIWCEPSLAEVLRARKRGEQNRSEEPVDTAHQGAEVATLSIPERCSSRVEGRRSTGERKSAKILPFPELLRA